MLATLFRSAANSTRLGLVLSGNGFRLAQVAPEDRRIIRRIEWREEDSRSPEGALPDRAVVAELTRWVRSMKLSGAEVVLCVRPPFLSVQNLRIPRLSEAESRTFVIKEVERRVPWPLPEVDLRLTPVAEIRHADSLVKEHLIFAAHRPYVAALLRAAEEAELVPVAIDAEPCALLRGISQQFRRDEDRAKRLLGFYLGREYSLVFVGSGEELLFVRQLPIGADALNKATADSLRLSVAEARRTRLYQGDRRSDARDPELTRLLQRALRPLLQKLVDEISTVARYHGVAFRGETLDLAVTLGDEVDSVTYDAIASAMEFPCARSEPLRGWKVDFDGSAEGWDLAIGLASRSVEEDQA
ncbi:MAG TPA: pilus assembly protein PilM [Pirellulaceae bacterium]|jgi:Tfp pilus assembly PilM family ATPase|nr:pilus assembly protein PilM [Pirellulaceae bacterium]